MVNFPQSEFRTTLTAEPNLSEQPFTSAYVETPANGQQSLNLVIGDLAHPDRLTTFSIVIAVVIDMMILIMALRVARCGRNSVRRLRPPDQLVDLTNRYPIARLWMRSQKINRQASGPVVYFGSGAFETSRNIARIVQISGGYNMYCKRMMICGLSALFCAVPVSADESATPSGSLRGIYMGQNPPGATPVFFAEGFVNTPMDMHGQIVFTPDLAEAFWHPDRPTGLYCSRMVNGEWTTPREINFVEGLMHDAPCYSADGQRLFFAAAVIGASGKTESDRFFCVDRKGDGWTEARPVDSVFDAFSLHWQFSVAADGSIYFGGNPKGVQGRSDIWLSQYANGRYAAPVRLPSTVASEGGEFSPCIAPDGSYLVFNRITFGPGGPPTMSLYVSFRTPDGSWSESQCLDSVLQGKGNDLNAKISPDGKYLFFIRRGGAQSGTFWVSTSVLEALRPIGE